MKNIEDSLHWHALNYRTAATQHAHEMFMALEDYVQRLIKEALAGAEGERQPEQDPSCAECGVNGGYALYCVACAEKFVGGYKEQEPVAFLTNRRQRLTVEFNATGFTLMPKSVDWKIPLYTTPPQRTWEKPWVSLTDEEQKTIADLASANDWHDFDVIDATEAKLKEKNT